MQYSYICTMSVLCNTHTNPSIDVLSRVSRYSQIINQLTWMTHAHNLKRVSQEHKIDLYLRPPNIGERDQSETTPLPPLRPPNIGERDQSETTPLPPQASVVIF
jgi:hypothetical protein